jgi:hypothetical protein
MPGKEDREVPEALQASVDKAGRAAQVHSVRAPSDLETGVKAA